MIYRFRSITTNKVFNIENSLTCSSANVVYLAQCVDCNLQGGGSFVNFTNRTLSPNVELGVLLTILILDCYIPNFV